MLRYSGKRRHQTLLTVLVTAFLVLDFSLLFINFSLSQRIEQNAQFINLAGRQRMLTQLIAKDLLLLPDANGNNDAANRWQNLINNMSLFDATLKAFADGGSTLDADKIPVTLKALKDTRSQELIQQATGLWEPIYQMLQSTNSQQIPDPVLTKRYATDGSNRLLLLMNELTVHVESLSQQNISRLRTVQLIIFLIVLLSFFAMLIWLESINRANANSRQQLTQLTKHLNEAVLLIDAQKNICFANSTACQLLKQSEGDLVDTPIEHWLPSVLTKQQLNLNAKVYSVDTAIVSSLPSELRMISLNDITEKLSLKAQTTTDPLTGLLNRIGLSEYYQELCHRHCPIACLFLDLDKFKPVNDQFGHAVGDVVLHIVAKRFVRCLKDTDAIARVGGDEFVILFPAPAHEDDLDELCDRLEQAISQPIQVEQHRAKIGVSIGLAMADANTLSLDELLMRADQAMYLAKEAKKQLNVTAIRDRQ